MDTPMLDFFFHLCIAPPATAMHGILFGAHTLTDSWGASLVLLSLAVNIALIPVYHLAETWQEAERAVQRAMEPKLREIKAVFAGRERYMYTRALYRLHGYSPLYALRTSVGLLIQIPFFFAAYHLLNAAPELAGQQWLFLNDLSRPDGLIALGALHLNLLPFVMTGANLASAAVYTSRLTGREKIQLYGLAALFLVLLYPSSAALLVYWTCNNLFSLGKNVVYTRFIYGKDDSVAPAGLAAPASFAGVPGTPLAAEAPPACAAGRAARVADIATAVCAGIAFAAAAAMRKQAGLTPLLFVCASTLLAATALALRLRMLRKGISLKHRAVSCAYGIFPIIIALVVALCTWKLTSFKKTTTPATWAFFRLYAVSIGLMAGWAFARQPLQPLLCRLGAFLRERLTPQEAGSVFFAASLTMAVLVCWYTPASLYASDPDFFYESFAVLAGRLTFRGLCFILLCGVLYRAARNEIRPLLATVWAWAAVGALLFTFAATGDYGTMDEFTLQNPALLKTRLGFLVDLAVLGASALIIGAVVRKRRTSGKLASMLQGAAFALLLAAGWQSATAPAAETISPEQASVRLPDYNDALFGFSRDGDNTLVLMLDMFTGSHMELILEAAPELRQDLDGFVWYPDTVSPGATTLLSIGALLGGEDYTAPAINARKPDSLKKELHKAFAVLPDIFVPRGYSAVLADVDELVPSLFEKTGPAARQTLVVGKPLATAYTPYWRNKMGLPSPLPETRAPFLGSVGLFHAAPWVLRNHIYFDGFWLNTRTVVHNPSEGPYAMLDVLPEVSNTEQPESTLKYITSQVAHYPWRLDEATCMPVDRGTAYTVGNDRVIHEHVVNERCGITALARWFRWMKANGVYDNTLIILVSDHDGNDSARFGDDFDALRPGKGTPWKPDALLLVKQRNSRGELQTDHRPMSSADVVPLICRSTGPCPGTAHPDPLLGDGRHRVRTHSAGLASIRRHDTDKFITTDYRITGTMFDKENWEKME